ncbi:SWR1 complex subunit swc3 [Hypsizygus marmoreus]|uniref:SWR1 complex subunit swc3 n=1 Tax=Hypsizygus marmoreus TaxID=39966 RepID=A0A369K253_HYPMA|nr:SWR1 complex subunit swc3 [Hypsizygus marmoreus]
MNRPVTAPVNLPVGSEPGWELDNNEDDEALKSIPESCVLLHSLRQSREKWLTSMFPRFSIRSRGGKTSDQAPQPPPHTIQTRGKCDLEIGPHTFPDTVFYEVHYLSPQTHLPSLPGYAYQPQNSSWQAKTPYGAYAQPTSTNVAPTSFELEKSSTPLISSLTAVTTITPALINQVNSAASSNPILANLLQLAAAGKATAEQLKTLGLLIQSLATSESTQILPPSGTSSQTQPTLPSTPSATETSLPSPAPIREFDLVLEFRETPYERWVFPRGVVTCETVMDTPGATPYTILKARIPFDKANTAFIPMSDAPSLANAKDEPAHVVSFRIKRTPPAVWDTIWRWIGGERKIQENRKILETIDSPGREYLGYQLAQGSLLSQLQVATAPTFSMKLLKPSTTSTPRTKRKVARQKTDTPQTQTTGTSTPQNSKGESVTSAKRRRVSHHGGGSTIIQCSSCKRTDVPLIQGGKFCHSCVDAGRGTPVAQLYQFTSYVPTTTNHSNTPVSVTPPNQIPPVKSTSDTPPDPGINE